MLIRLFQTFESVSLNREAQPSWSRPPASWKAALGKRKAKEEFWPKTHLTMYSHVSPWFSLVVQRTLTDGMGSSTGRIVDHDGDCESK
jgi:hypothetical protein